MATTVQFGRWKLTRGSSTSYATRSNVFEYFLYHYYDKIVLDTSYTGSNALTWKGFTYAHYDKTGCQYYVSDNFAIYGISFVQAQELINNVGIVTYNSKRYRLALLDSNMWQEVVPVQLGTLTPSLQFPVDYHVITATRANCNDCLTVVNSKSSTDAEFSPGKYLGICTQYEAYYIPVLIEIKENYSPVIRDAAGSEFYGKYDLGLHDEPFGIPYEVYDPDDGDKVTITESINGRTIRTIYDAQQYTTYMINITDSMLKEFGANSINTVTVHVSDGHASTVKQWRFIVGDPHKNTPPTISDSDRHLGDKYAPFSVSYTISDADKDPLMRTETLNGSTICIQDYMATDTQCTCYINSYNFDKLAIGSTNTIVISVTDGKETTKRTYTFKKVAPPVVNNAPTISGYDRHLGDQYQAFNVSYYVNDVDTKDTLTITERINGTAFSTVKSNAIRNQMYYFDVPTAFFDLLPMGKNTMTIEVTDGKATTTRILTFNKINVPNTAPQIVTGGETTLGDKYSSFSYSYHFVDPDVNDTFTVTETVNNTQIRKITNATRNQLYYLTVSDAQLSQLALDATHTITISVSDGKATTSKSVSFRRVPIPNNHPTISDYDRYLGEKYESFSINYSVNDIDSRNVLTIKESLNGENFLIRQDAIRNKTYTCTVDSTKFNKLCLNTTNTLAVSVFDGTVTTMRVWSFKKVAPPNSPPFITGLNSNYGSQNKPFTISFILNDSDNDPLNVTIKLNSKTIKTLTGAVAGNTYHYNIPTAEFLALANNSTNTITIQATDGKETATASTTFVKVNNAPVINYSGSTSLGKLIERPTIQYSVTDAESHYVTITEKLNGRVIASEYGQCTSTNNMFKRTLTLSEDEWDSCGKTNVIELIAEDECGASTTKTISFAKNIGDIHVVTKPVPTTIQPTKISLDIDWTADSATGKVFACNNALDANPTWEDMTDKINTKDMYLFTNKTKTEKMWAISIKVIIYKDEDNEGTNCIYNIKGTFE